MIMGELEFWNEYFNLEEKGRTTEARHLYFSYLVKTFFKELILVYLPLEVVVWYLTSWICSLIF